MTADCQFTSGAYNGRSVTDPATLANSDSTSIRNSLFDNWYFDIFVRVIMVQN